MTANLKWSDFEHYLKGEHLNGRKVTATIAEIVIEETHAQAGRTEEKPVCYFKESKKGLGIVRDFARKMWPCGAVDNNRDSL